MFGGEAGGGGRDVLQEWVARWTTGMAREQPGKRGPADTPKHAREEAIAQKETEYLDNTASGNIIMGFDNYIKGITGAAAQRRKSGVIEANRVFSRSSISYNVRSVATRKKRQCSPAS